MGPGCHINLPHDQLSVYALSGLHHPEVYMSRKQFAGTIIGLADGQGAFRIHVHDDGERDSTRSS